MDGVSNETSCVELLLIFNRKTTGSPSAKTLVADVSRLAVTASGILSPASRLWIKKLSKSGTGGQQQQGGQPTQQHVEPVAPATRQMSAATSAGRSGTGQATAKTDAEMVFGE